ncbi:hypothetical protein Cfor_10606 [Coptotermes formosanus]|jgi:catenin alpha|uniref:Uncharacterized protein n=1 Tax=Coptotermes formosanus TaxID=36987 RepID=A0A6L2QBB4_COPFO|nr:hypothetical protein Cfor_10606 [Coptotermes formosanus]
MADHFGPITLKWDPKNLEIRTMSVEKTLEPLVLQVSLLLGPAVKELCRNRICKHFFINL